MPGTLPGGGKHTSLRVFCLKEVILRAAIRRLTSSIVLVGTFIVYGTFGKMVKLMVAQVSNWFVKS